MKAENNGRNCRSGGAAYSSNDENAEMEDDEECEDEDEDYEASGFENHQL